MSQILEKPRSIHSPTLDTVMMVEDSIKKARQVMTIASLKRRLPRQVNHYTLKAILAYLQQSGKIEFTPYGLLWIFTPRHELNRLIARGREL